MFSTADFADHVCRFSGSWRHAILNVYFHPDRLTAFEEALEQLLILGRDADNGNFVIGVEAESSGVRQMQSSGLRATLPADHGDCMTVIGSPQKRAVGREAVEAILGSLAPLHNQKDFARPLGLILLDLILQVVRVDNY